MGATRSPRDRATTRLASLAVAVVAYLVAAPSAGAAEGDLNFLQSFTDGAAGVDGLLGANAVTVSPDGENLYVAGRFDHSVAVFSRNPVSGVLNFQEVEKDGVAGVNGLLGARRVVVSPDGQDVYVTGSEDDAIVVFDRSQVDGTLAFNEVELDSADPTARGLDRALGLEVTQDGKFVYVAGEFDHAINIFSRSLATGTLDFIGKVAQAIRVSAGSPARSASACLPTPPSSTSTPPATRAIPSRHGRETRPPARSHSWA